MSGFLSNLFILQRDTDRTFFSSTFHTLSVPRTQTPTPYQYQRDTAQQQFENQVRQQQLAQAQQQLNSEEERNKFDYARLLIEAVETQHELSLLPPDRQEAIEDGMRGSLGRMMECGAQCTPFEGSYAQARQVRIRIRKTATSALWPCPILRSIRSEKAIEMTEQTILNSFHTGPRAVMGALAEYSNSVQTFIDAAKQGKQPLPTPGASGVQWGRTDCLLNAYGNEHRLVGIAVP